MDWPERKYISAEGEDRGSSIWMSSCNFHDILTWLHSASKDEVVSTFSLHGVLIDRGQSCLKILAVLVLLSQKSVMLRRPSTVRIRKLLSDQHMLVSVFVICQKECMILLRHSLSRRLRVLVFMWRNVARSLHVLVLRRLRLSRRLCALVVQSHNLFFKGSEAILKDWSEVRSRFGTLGKTLKDCYEVFCQKACLIVERLGRSYVVYVLIFGSSLVMTNQLKSLWHIIYAGLIQIYFVR